MKLERFNINSEQFSLKSGQHSILVKDVSGSLSDFENEMVVSVSLPYIQYNFFDETFGEGEIQAQSNLDFTIPRSTGDRLQNKSISGKLIVDKMIYYKALEFQITPNSLNRILTMFNNFITRLRTTEAQAYYNIILGCIADNNDESTDWNKIAGKAIGKVISTTANKTLGGDYIGDIDMKVMLFATTPRQRKGLLLFQGPDFT